MARPPDIIGVGVIAIAWLAFLLEARGATNLRMHSNRSVSLPALSALQAWPAF